MAEVVERRGEVVERRGEVVWVQHRVVTSIFEYDVFVWIDNKYKYV